MENKSCLGCKYLYLRARGYSNWTCIDTEANCAKDKNKNLPADAPDDWPPSQNDNWVLTNSSRCGLYAPGEMVCLDVEGDDGPADHVSDVECIEAVCNHSGRGAHGDI